MATAIDTASGKLLTKYFYKENQLCFQILLTTSGEKTTVVGEFSNYSEYRKAFTTMLNQIENNVVIELNISGEQQYHLSKVA